MWTDECALRCAAPARPWRSCVGGVERAVECIKAAHTGDAAPCVRTTLACMERSATLACCQLPTALLGWLHSAGFQAVCYSSYM